VTGSIADVGARLVLTGRSEFTGGIDAAKKAVLDLGTANKNTAATSKDAAVSADKQAAAAKKVADTSTAAAGGADKLAAAQKRVAVSTAELAAAQREYEASMALGAVTGADAVASADLQVEALNRVKRAEAEVALAAKDSAKVQAESAAAAADATVASADKSVAADAKAGEGAKSKGIMSSKAIFGIAAAGAVLGYESIKLATGFETQMTRLTTAAGMPKPIVDASKQAVIDLGTQTGFTGTQMAEALYHPISAGLDMATSLNVVRDSAKEARISGANLDDTTYSLSSVMKAFNVGADGSAQTMATLNAIVGQGDMRFQDFNTSVKGWAAPAATFGVSVQSVGAALAYMTDRGVPAAQAGTQLGMSMTLMAAPTKQATKILTGVGVPLADITKAAGPMRDALKKAGVSTTQMADDMRKPNGIKVALQDLNDHLIKSGMTADGAAAVVARAFGGGKSGKAIMSLIGNLDGLQQKYDAIGEDSTPEKFAAAWEQTKNTTKFQLDSLKASFENFGIKIGSVLLPYVDKAIAGFSKFFGFLSENKTAMMVFAGVVGVLLVSAFVALGISIIAATWPIILIVGAIAGLAAGFMYLWNHVEGFRNFWKTAWADIQKWATEAWPYIKAAASEAIAFLERIVADVITFFRDHWGQVVGIVKPIWDWIVTETESLYHRMMAWIQPIVDMVRSHWDEIALISKVVWDEILAVLSIVWGAIKGIFDSFLPLIVGLLDVTWQVILQAVHVAWDLIVGILRTAWDLITGAFTTARDIVLGIISVLLDLLTGNWHQAWDDIVHFTGKILNDIIDGIKNPLSDMLDAAKHILSDLYNGFADIAHAIWDTVTNTFKGGINGVLDLVNGFLGAINTIAGAVGLNLNLHVDPIGSGGGGAPPPASAPLASTGLRTGSSTAGLAAGGLLHGPGTGTSDSILGMDYFTGMPTAYVSNGEFVVKEKSYREYPAEVEAINAGTFPKLAVGGPIPGLAGGGATWPAMFSVIKGQFPDALDNSDFRPGDPGYHGRGQALDVGFAGDDNAKLTDASQWIASKYGAETSELIHKTGRNIKNGADVGDGYGLYGASTMDAHLNHTHWAMDHDPGGGGKGLLGTLMGAFSSAVSAIRHIAAGALDAAWPKMPVPQNMMGLLPATANKLRDGVISFVNGQDQARGGGDAGGGTGAIPTGDHLALIDAALTADGIAKDQWPKWEAGLNTLIGRESSWNPNAINNTDINAQQGHPSQGLMQTIPSTFESNRNPTIPGGITDPLANIAAGVNYINRQYGGIGGVQQANAGAPPKGYYLGGIVGMDPQTAFEHRFMGGPVNTGQPYVVGERGPEVFVPTTAGVIVPAAGGAGGGGGSSSTVTTSSSTFGARTVNVAAGAIVIHESGNPQATYEAVKQALQDEVARR